MSTAMATSTLSDTTTTTISALAAQSAPAQGALSSAGAGITGGYTGNSLSLQIIIAFLIGLALYNAIELLVLNLVTFNKYSGLYFWSLVVAGFGVIPYSLGFLIKFFQLLDPNASSGYVAVVLVSLGWYMMITGQSVVLWSRLHLLSNSRRILRYTLYMIIANVFFLHVPTTILTFGANSNDLSDRTLMRFVNGYSIMEKIQMAGFFVQETVLSLIYIRETLRLLKLSQSVQDDITSVIEEGDLRQGHMRKTMYQLLTVNAIIITMDVVLLAVEFANLYLIETVLKGVVYSIKLKLEFAVLGKLVQIVVTKHSNSSGVHSSLSRRVTPPIGEHRDGEGIGLEKLNSNGTARSVDGSGGGWYGHGHVRSGSAGGGGVHPWPSFVDPNLVSGDVTHAALSKINSLPREDESWEVESEKRNRRIKRSQRGSWIEEEMNKHNIG
ncbi:hypothetical protein P280DRAFT_129122 [Massarina eburnea CBS 473.64]|uniref:DUF7703 domain-containing protein n=1 Tax=Massarina eburnea CBS 473.64 TaxID=1395130 RepID=A0A6A6SE03_9PLEO|nr:hypothetical protein P280DRAFT_129122 [Massarina eburnea CBS 473.64]